MAIWLRHARREDAVMPEEARAGACSDVLSVRDFATLVTLDEGFRQLADERETVLRAAHEEAAHLIVTAQASAAELIDAARRERDCAKDVGYRQGEQEAIADWMERVARAGDARTLMHERMRERLASLVSMAVEKIVAVQQREALFERALVEIDRIAGGAAYLNVSVHPSDHAFAQAAFDRLAARWRDLGQPFPVTVVADRRLEPGSCIAESDLGAIDAGLETQLSAMRTAVSRALKHAAQASDERAAAAGAGSGAQLDSRSNTAAEPMEATMLGAFAHPDDNNEWNADV